MALGISFVYLICLDLGRMSEGYFHESTRLGENNGMLVQKPAKFTRKPENFSQGIVKHHEAVGAYHYASRARLGTTATIYLDGSSNENVTSINVEKRNCCALNCRGFGSRVGAGINQSTFNWCFEPTSF